MQRNECYAHCEKTSVLHSPAPSRPQSLSKLIQLSPPSDQKGLFHCMSSCHRKTKEKQHKKPHLNKYLCSFISNFTSNYTTCFTNSGTSFTLFGQEPIGFWLGKQSTPQTYTSKQGELFGTNSLTRGGGGYSTMFIRGGSALRSNPLPFICYFSGKRYPFRTPSIDKWNPFQIPCLELCIPLNRCKCTVF